MDTEHLLGRTSLSGDKRLAKELDFYALHKDEWIKTHRAYYVVVNDENVLDFFLNFETAYRSGVLKWGIHTDFLVRQIVDDEPVVSVFQVTTMRTENGST